MLSAEQIVVRLQELRSEIKALSELDSRARQSRGSRGSEEHSARLARLAAIKIELAALMGRKSYAEDDSR
jgi:Zn-dependent oligopeptidase